MQYSPKLKKAMEEIKKVMNKYDIGGVVVIHTPGFSEYLNKIDPSYSALSFNRDGSGFSVKGHSKHYGGDKNKRDETVAHTRNMVEHIINRSGQFFMIYEEISKKMDDTFGKWDHESGDDTSHNQQNN